MVKEKKHVPHRLFNRRFLDIQSLGIFRIKRKAGFDTSNDVGDDHQYLRMKPPIYMAMIYHEYGHSETRSFDFSKIWLLRFLDIVLPGSLVPLFVSPLVFSWPLPSFLCFLSLFIIGDAVCLLAPPILVNVMWSQGQDESNVNSSTFYGSTVWSCRCLVLGRTRSQRWAGAKKYVYISTIIENTTLMTSVLLHHLRTTRDTLQGCLRLETLGEIGTMLWHLQHCITSYLAQGN